MKSNSPSATGKPSSLWFFSGFFAVILAGLAKIAIADHFSPDK